VVARAVAAMVAATVAVDLVVVMAVGAMVAATAAVD
jgi:hypothetical protein